MLGSLVQTAAYQSLPAGDRHFINHDGVCRDVADTWMRGYRSEAEAQAVPGARVSDPERAL